jgi:hypothetical protein
MRRLYPLCERLAGSNVAVLIEGETGTGKEVLAESLHEKSARAEKPFVVFDCTAVPPDLMEAALFGHERGAFTGAVSAQKGLFELADGGTLFIDEIGELSPALQPKLLRALDRSEVRRIGGTEWIKMDVRLIGRHPPRSGEGDPGRPLPRRSLLPPGRGARRAAPPAPAPGRHRPPGRSFWKQLGPTPAPSPTIWSCASRATPGPATSASCATPSRSGWRWAISSPSPCPAPPPGCTPSRCPGDDVLTRVLALNLPLSQARDMVVEDFERRYLQKMMRP